MIKVVLLRNEPSLNDIPGQLRALADRIESGKYGEVESVLAIIPQDNGWPITFGWGNVVGNNEPVIQFQLALHAHIHNIMHRP